MADLLHRRDVPVADERPVLVVISGRKRHDPVADPRQVLGLAGEHGSAVLIIAVVKRADADGVAGGDKYLPLRVVQDQGKLRVQHPEHIRAVLPVQGQQHLTVGLALERIALLLQLPLQLLKAIDLAVADHIASVQLEGLHA